MRIEQVTKPSGCPFREWYEDYSAMCKFENGNKEDDCDGDKNFPPGCPIVTQDILVLAKTNVDEETA